MLISWQRSHLQEGSRILISFSVAPISAQQQLVLLRPALPHARDVDRRPAEHRALVLADAAADAELQVHARLLDRDDLPRTVPDPRLLEPDGLLRRGADLLAHDAGRRVGPG